MSGGSSSIFSADLRTLKERQTVNIEREIDSMEIVFYMSTMHMYTYTYIYIYISTHHIIYEISNFINQMSKIMCQIPYYILCAYLEGLTIINEKHSH